MNTNRENLLINFITVMSEDCSNPLTFAERLKHNFPMIVKEYKIGRLGIRINAPVSALAPQGFNHDVIIYDDRNADSQNAKVFEYRTGEDGKCTFTIAGLKNDPWDEEDEKNIVAIAGFLYAIAGRSRMASMLLQSRMLDLSFGVPNMAGLSVFAGQLIARGMFGEYAMIFLNVKNFKIFNKREGASAGDEVLKKYNETLNAFCNPDEFYCRPGGDNGVFLIRKNHLDTVLEQLSHVHIKFHKGEHVNDCPIDAWAGIYLINNGDKLADALQYSSIALTTVRQNASDKLQLFYNEGMLKQYVRQKEVISVFPIALQKEEFVVFYQPKVSVDNRKLSGAEALVRWYRDGVVVPPMDFVPVLEENSLIYELDFYVFDKTCRNIKEWLNRGLEPVRISTNFSRGHLKNTNTADRILSIMERYGVDGKYIQVEITEMSGYEDIKEMLKLIAALHEYGVTVAIDDFGIGYSSLNLLKDYDADIVKIDKSLLFDVVDNEKARKLLEYIIMMSHDIGMDVVIEGVETKEQLDYVNSIGCDYVQGFYFDKPLPDDEFVKRLETMDY